MEGGEGGLRKSLHGVNWKEWKRISKCRNSQTLCGQALAARKTNHDVLIHLNRPVQINPQGRSPDQLLRNSYWTLQNVHHTPSMLLEIYENISTNFPYYNAEESSGWKSSVRHNLSIYSHFQKVKSEDGTGNYWEMTCNFGTDVFIGEKCGKLHRTGNFVCSNITQSKDESLFFDSSLSSSPDSPTGQKSSSSSPELDMDSPKRRPYSFYSIIAMAIQSSPQKRMRLQEIYEYISTNFPYYKAKKSLGWQNSIRQNLSMHIHFQKVSEEDGQGNYWEMKCDFGTDVYIGETSGSILRRKNSKEQPAPPPPLPMDHPNIALMPNPYFYNPATMMLQNQILIRMMIQNYQLQQSHQASAAIGTLPPPPFL
ncbi:unnamed protein product [Caenorhabditis brenneri]